MAKARAGQAPKCGSIGLWASDKMSSLRGRPCNASQMPRSGQCVSVASCAARAKILLPARSASLRWPIASHAAASAIAARETPLTARTP